MARKGGGERNHDRHKSGGGWFGGGLGSSSAGGETGGGGVDLHIKTFAIEDGQISYIDAQSGAAPVRVNALNLKIENFSFTSPFNIELDMAAMGASKNLELTGTAGPIVQDGAVDVGAIPVAMEATVGPLTLAQMKSVPDLAKSIPPALAISDELQVKAKASGTVNAITFEAASDLTASRVTFAPNFDKPSGVPLKFTASGVRHRREIEHRAGQSDAGEPCGENHRYRDRDGQTLGARRYQQVRPPADSGVGAASATL